MNNMYHIELLTGLARIWAEDNEIKMSISNTGYSAELTYKFIYVPQELVEKIPDFPNWRIMRSRVFHESMHILHSPKDFNKVLSRRNINRNIYNTIEDYRVENCIGLKEYVGYQNEFKYYLEFVKNLYKDNAIDNYGYSVQSKFNENSPEDKSLKAGLVLMNHVYGMGFDIKMDDLVEQKYLEDMAKQVKDIEKSSTIESSFDIAEKISRRLNLHFNLNNNNNGIGASPNDKITSDMSDDLGSYLKGLSKSLKKADKKVKSSDQIKSEFKNMKDKKEDSDKMIAATKKEDTKKYEGIRFNEITPKVYSLSLDNITQIMRMKSMLRRLQLGWDEVNDRTGSDIDIDEFINRSDNPFLDEKKIAPHTSAFLLVDMSSSISTFREHYIDAMKIISETLHFLKFKFEIAAFNGSNRRCNIYKVKMFNEPFSTIQKSKLEGLKTQSSTPLSTSLKYATDRCKINGIRRVYVITDGCSTEEMKIDARKMQMKGIELRGLGIVYSDDNVRYQMESGFENLLKLDKSKYTILSNLNNLPNEFFRLVRN